MSARIAVNLPCASTAREPCSRWSRDCASVRKLSARVAVQPMVLPVSRAAARSRANSGYGVPRAPKPPPMSGNQDVQSPGLDAEHACEDPAHAVRGLASEGEGPGAVRGVVAGDGGSGLEKYRGDAVVREGHFDHVRGGRERGFGGLAIALFPVERDVAGVVLPYRGFGGARLLVGRYRRQRFVLHDDRFGRIERLRFGFGDDHRDRFARVSGLRCRDRRLAGIGHRRAVAIQPRERRDACQGRNRTDPSPDLPACDHGDHAVHRPRRRCIDFENPSVRMG